MPTFASWPQNYQTHAAAQTWRADSVSSWNFLSRCTVAQDPTIKLAGDFSWKITPDGSGTTQTRALNLAVPIDCSQEILCVRVFCADDPNAGSFQVIASNSGANVTNAAILSSNTNAVRPGWNFLTYRFTGRSDAGQPVGYQGNTYGTGATASLINAIEFDYTGTPTKPFWIDSISIGRRVRPAVVFGFDVSMQQGLVDWALPSLSSMGANAYLAISFQSGITDFAANAHNATARAAGWRFVFHSTAHVNYVGLSTQQLIDDWSSGMQAMRTRGWFDGQPAEYQQFFVPPENGWNYSVSQTLRGLGVRYGRGLAGIRNYPDIYGLDYGQMLQGSIELNSGTSLAAAQGYVDDCIRMGYLLHFFGHGLTAGAANSLEWNKDDFIALCAYIKRRKDQGVIDTPEWLDWYRGLTQPTLVA